MRRATLCLSLAGLCLPSCAGDDTPECVNLPPYTCDASAPVDATAETPIDLSRDARDLLAPDLSEQDLAPDLIEPDMRVQGTSCADKNATFTASAPPQPGAVLKDVTVLVTQPYAWPMIAVGPPGANTSALVWTGGPVVVGSGPTFRFDNVVCGSPAPLAFYLLKDATSDDPAKGTTVATCVP